ncbi:MAG: FAD-dependent oxidoreductase [Actinomycetes bacterium]
MPDVVVIGGGPSGLATATALRALGVGDVVVLERESEAGGIPRHSAHLGYGIRDLKRVLSGPGYARTLVRRAVDAGVDIRTSATATEWGEKLGVCVTSPSGRYTLDCSALVVATGCRERPRAARLVPGSRPAGVVTTGQLQQMVHLNHQVPGRRAVVVGAEHVSYSAVMTLAEAGCSVAAMVTEQPRHTSFQAFDTAARARWRFPVHTQARVTDIGGRERVEWVEISHADGSTEVVSCDTVVFTGDWIADHELARRQMVDIDHRSTGVVVDTGSRSSSPGVFAVGNVVHPAETADACSLEGQVVAQSVLSHLHGAPWPTSGVPITVAEPLSWVSPSRISDRTTPARGRFVLRGSDFRRRPTICVSQGGHTLWQGTAPRLVPTRPLYVPSSWLSAVDLSANAAPVSIELASH